MKTKKNKQSASSLSVMRKAIKRTELRIPLLTAVLMIFLVPFSAMAARERFVLDFNDSNIRGYQGEAATIFLKKSLKDQYPWVEISDMDLRNVLLVAKSKMGRGGASLRVGDRATDMCEIAGNPRSFNDYRRYTFDQIQFRNPSSNSRGPWQIDLKGNFIVRKVVLEVEDHSRPRHNQRWQNHRR